MHLQKAPLHCCCCISSLPAVAILIHPNIRQVEEGGKVGVSYASRINHLLHIGHLILCLQLPVGEAK